MNTTQSTVVRWVALGCVTLGVCAWSCKEANPKPYMPSDVSGKWVLGTGSAKKFLSMNGGAYLLESAPDIYAPGKTYPAESGSYSIVVDSIHFDGSRYLYDVNRALLDSLAVTCTYKYTIRNDTMYVSPQWEGQGWLVKIGE